MQCYQRGATDSIAYKVLLFARNWIRLYDDDGYEKLLKNCTAHTHTMSELLVEHGRLIARQRALVAGATSIESSV